MLPVLTDKAMRQLVAVNGEVNTYSPAADLAQYRVVDFWQEIGVTGRGDCEDYALEKQRRLRGLGWPQESLRLAVCLTPEGDGHCVLTVDTAGGAYVLDNLDPVVRAWTDTPYRWIKRQAPKGAGWVAIPAL